MPYNEFGQPVGEIVTYRNFLAPTREVLDGHYCRLEKISEAKHGKELYDNVFSPSMPPHNWTYMGWTSFATREECTRFVQGLEASKDPYFYVIINKKTNRVAGTAAIGDIDLVSGAAETRWVIYADELKRTAAATEAQYLLARYVFEELHYRRLSWRLDSLNKASQRSAERFGYTYEATHRQNQIVKGRSKDTAWLSIIDGEWPYVKYRLEKWLSPANFDSAGRQRTPLEAAAKL